MPFLHLPVQSGSDRILTLMNRRHTAGDYRRIVELLRSARSDLALSSDLIVGYPGETDEDFQATLDLVGGVRFAQAFSFKYSPRPGTPAASAAGQVAEQVKSERLAALQLPTELPVSVPSQLVEQRPDVRSSEELLRSASAQVGVAISAYYPTVTLSFAGGLESTSISEWFTWPSRFWSVGPNIELPLFTGGLNRANLARTHAAYDESLADYRQTVLGAFVEVEDSLAAQQWLADEWNAENEAVVAA